VGFPHHFFNANEGTHLVHPTIASYGMSSSYQPISASTPLKLAKITDIPHLKACSNSFEKTTSTRKSTEEELAAVQQLIATHKSCRNVRSPQHQLVWLYAMHPDERLSQLAIHTLSAPHQTTQGFEHLELHRQKNLLHKLIQLTTTAQSSELSDKKPQSNNAAKTYLQIHKFAESIAQRGLSSSDTSLVSLAASLLHQLSKFRPIQTLYPLDLLNARQQFIDNLDSPLLRSRYPQLRLQLLTLLLIENQRNYQKHIELKLAKSWRDQQIKYTFPVIRVLRILIKLFEEKSADLHGDHSETVLAWRISLLNTAISDRRTDIRNFAEIALYQQLVKDKSIAKFIDIEKIASTRNQSENEGKGIEPISVTRVQLHAHLISPTKQHIEFYHQYRDIELGKKITDFLSQFLDSEFQLLSSAQSHGIDLPYIEQMFKEMITDYPFNLRRHLTKKTSICNRFFDLFLNPGLPLHSLDAIKHVDWQAFKQSATTEAIQRSKNYLTRIATLNPTMQQDLMRKFTLIKEDA